MAFVIGSPTLTVTYELWEEYYDDKLNGLNTIKYENYNPLEPKYTNIKEVINILQNLKVQLKKLHPAHINVNNLYTILNHILNPEIIYQQINSIDNQAKIDFINLILFVYHYLPSYIIEKLTVKMYVVTLYSKDYVRITKKLIRKKKIREFVSNFIDNSGHLLTLILIFILILIGSFISWFISLF